MRQTYDAGFEDRRGRETTSIRNDGHELQLSLRGVDFSGDDFDSLSPIAAHLSRARSLFTLQLDCLCSCRLEWEMPVELERDDQRLVGVLSAVLVLGDPMPNGWSLSSADFALSLKTPDGTIVSSGSSGLFEDEFLDLRRTLADSTSIRSCVACAFAGYSPAGKNLFSGLACFRDAKDDYVKVRDKAGLFAIWERMTEFVQETYLCSEFKPQKS